ncbi:MAG: HEPN domain-containing protein, partial [Sedimentisphaerales bacterium]|nr:HEPN domain-containing protein [Sedimentisphaerales bacterium]
RLKSAKAYQKITAFYFIERYPLLVEEEVTEDDVRDCFKKAEGFVNKLRI